MRPPILLAFAVLVLAACATVPYTKRSQLLFLSESQEMQLGADAYKEVLKKEKIETNAAVVALVRDVGLRIAKVANKPEYKWEFTVIDEPKTANAFALPGGKVAVYTGIFPVAHDTAGLAAVLGHEVGHAIAHHAGERMSQGIIIQAIGTAATVALGSYSAGTQQAIMQAFGLGAQVGVILPFGRSQEAEADHIGLILMAQAGYDPHAALQLWQRFEQMNKQAPPEFLSTHPSYGTREHNIQSWMPEAMSYYHEDATAKVELLPGES